MIFAHNKSSLTTSSSKYSTKQLTIFSRKLLNAQSDDIYHILSSNIPVFATEADGWTVEGRKTVLLGEKEYVRQIVSGIDIFSSLNERDFIHARKSTAI